MPINALLPIMPPTSTTFVEDDGRLTKDGRDLFLALIRYIREAGVLSETAEARLETLRVGLNEVRSDPLTIYPPITF